MTLDNDGNPQAPRHPSDPPPRRSPADGAQTEAEGVAAPARSPVEAPSKSADTGDATTPRAIVRAILAALPLPLRAAVVAAVLAWARSLAAVAGMVARRELSPSAALALTDAAAETLVDADDGAPPHVVVCAMLGAWWAAGPYDLARQVSKGTTGPADFTDAVEFLAAVEGDLDALAFVTSGARAEHNAPRIVRCPLPAGVLRLDTPSGVTFLPELPPNPLDANGRFDGPHVPDDGPTSAELSALVHDAAAFLGCHHAPDAAVTSARLLVLQAMNEGEGEAGGPALAMLGAALATVAANDARAASDAPTNAPVRWRDAVELAAWGSRVAGRALRMCSALCTGAADVRDTTLPATAPWRTGAA